MASSGVSLSNYLRLVRGNPNFRRLWIAQIVSENGDWFYTLAIYSLLLDLTGKASSIALALVLQVLPHTLLGPLSGMVNDRFSRRKIMIATDLLRMVIVACMLLVRSRGSVWVIYPLLFLETVMVAFFEPARSAVIPNVVAEGDVIVANTLSSATWSFDLAIGSVLGGIVAAWLGRDAVFVLNALSFAVSALLISRMHFVESHADEANRHPEDQGAGWSSIRAGFRYIANDPKLAAVVSLKAGVSILGASWVLLPVRARFPSGDRGYFACTRSFIRNELVNGRPWCRRSPRASVRIALDGTARIQPSPWRVARVHLGRHRISPAEWRSQHLGCVCSDCAGALRNINGLGIFHDTASPQCRRSISGKNLRCGLGDFNVRISSRILGCGTGA